MYPRVLGFGRVQRLPWKYYFLPCVPISLIVSFHCSQSALFSGNPPPFGDWGQPAAAAPAAPAPAPAAWAPPPAPAAAPAAPAGDAGPAAAGNPSPFGGKSLEYTGGDDPNSANYGKLRDRLQEADTERRKAAEEADARERAAEIRREERLKKIQYMQEMPDSQPAGTGECLSD